LPLSILPESATPDTRRLITARALRALADGAVSVLLASYLSTIGFAPFEISVLVTATLLGSAALTLAVGLFGQGISRRAVLLGASALMLATGLGFFEVTAFWPLLVIAFAGTLNPSGGDVSVFLPTEQAVLADTIADRDRTAVFARYNIAGSVAAALGALASGVPEAVARARGLPIAAAQRTGFVLYAVVAVVVALLYGGFSPSIERVRTGRVAPLARSRSRVLKLSFLFSLDSLGGGFTVQTLLVLWLYRRFQLSGETAAAVFFAAGLLAAGSQLVAPKLAARIGLIQTMVYTHLPANALLVLAALMPTAPLAITFLLLRMCLSQMDVPARQSYVMAVVPPDERAAAASVTNVPRSLAAATTPLLAGIMLDHSSFGWPLVCGGVLKALYDVLLLVQFRAVLPPEETG